MDEEIQEIRFNHSKDATAIRRADGGKVLEQDGNFFTFAEYHKNAMQTGTDGDGNPIFDIKGGHWVPEPQYMPNYEEQFATDRIADMLDFISKNLSQIVKLLPALEIYTRESIARAQVKDKSFNELKGKLGVMTRELAKYNKLKKLVSVKEELAKLENEVTEDGKQD